MAIGEIKRLQTETGIGFICQSEDSEEFLFHSTALIGGTFDRLAEGQRVEFDRQAYPGTSGKSRAINVRPTSEVN